jgi:hypothetical protein
MGDELRTQRLDTTVVGIADPSIFAACLLPSQASLRRLAALEKANQSQSQSQSQRE